METTNLYKSFNDTKTTEELQYNMQHLKIRLQEIIVDQKFYNVLLNASIFKPKVIGLFERLRDFKEVVQQTKKTASDLLIKADAHMDKISIKIECEDLACDNYFIKTHDELEMEIHEFLTKTASSKSRLNQYIQDIILT
jgi:hypothetical protein